MSYPGYIVTYHDPDGNFTSSSLVYRFDSLNELSAKTIASQKLSEGCSNVKICEVTIYPKYEVRHSLDSDYPEMVKLP